MYFFIKAHVSAMSWRNASEIFFRSSRPTASCTAHRMAAWSRKHFKLHAIRTTGVSNSRTLSPPPIPSSVVLSENLLVVVVSLLLLFKRRFQSLFMEMMRLISEAMIDGGAVNEEDRWRKSLQ